MLQPSVTTEKVKELDAVGELMLDADNCLSVRDFADVMQKTHTVSIPKLRSISYRLVLGHKKRINLSQHHEPNN